MRIHHYRSYCGAGGCRIPIPFQPSSLPLPVCLATGVRSQGVGRAPTESLTPLVHAASADVACRPAAALPGLNQLLRPYQGRAGTGPDSSLRREKDRGGKAAYAAGAEENGQWDSGTVEGQRDIGRSELHHSNERRRCRPDGATQPAMVGCNDRRRGDRAARAVRVSQSQLRQP